LLILFSWSVRRIAREFGIGRKKALRAKNLQEEQGFHATPNKSIRKSLSEEVVKN